MPGSAHQAREEPRSGACLSSICVLMPQAKKCDSGVTKVEDDDSGLDSQQEEVTKKEQSKECLIESDKMQVFYL